MALCAVFLQQEIQLWREFFTTGVAAPTGHQQQGHSETGLYELSFAAIDYHLVKAAGCEKSEQNSVRILTFEATTYYTQLFGDL